MQSIPIVLYILTHKVCHKRRSTRAASVDISRSKGVQSTLSGASPTISAKPRVVFAYGSETGTANEICKNLHADALQIGLNAEVRMLSRLPGCNSFWRSPSHGAQPLGLACFTPEFPPGHAGPPSPSPAPKTCKAP